MCTMIPDRMYSKRGITDDDKRTLLVALYSFALVEKKVCRKRIGKDHISKRILKEWDVS